MNAKATVLSLVLLSGTWVAAQSAGSGSAGSAGGHAGTAGQSATPGQSNSPGATNPNSGSATPTPGTAAPTPGTAAPRPGTATPNSGTASPTTTPLRRNHRITPHGLAPLRQTREIREMQPHRQIRRLRMRSHQTAARITARPLLRTRRRGRSSFLAQKTPCRGRTSGLLL